MNPTYNASLDHLVYAAPNLERGMQEIERLTGISPMLGGQHPGRGTRNALIALGRETYLEIVAPDPHQPAPAGPRWLGVDAVTEPCLTTWAAKATDLPTLRRRALENAVPIGEVQSAERRRADGATLSWHLTDPDPLIAAGLIPFFIDWRNSPHPARTAPKGASLIDLRLEHPDTAELQRILRILDLEISLTSADHPALIAVIQTPRGRVELRSAIRAG